MKFTKVQGAGNDFVLMEAGQNNRDWSKLAIDVCDRHFGIGADGLLVVQPSIEADYRMRVFNPDGSEAEACGNGLRCVVNYILEMGLVNLHDHELTIETLAGVRQAKVHHTEGGGMVTEVGMGVPRFAASEIPAIVDPSGRCGVVDFKPLLDYAISVGNKDMLIDMVSMGNPHAVHFIDSSVDEFPLHEIGPGVNSLDMFPVGVNFEVAQVISSSPPIISARVWERGVGETLACGSGACAITVVARLKKYVDEPEVDIKVPGGKLHVAWNTMGGEVYLSGPAKIVFAGEWLP